MISVYENQSGFRVVAGAHVPAAEHKKLQPRIYSSAAAAYATETNPSIRGAILRLDSTVAGSVTPDKMHHVVKKGEKAATVSIDRFIVESRGSRPSDGPFYIFDRYHGTSSNDYDSVTEALNECAKQNAVRS